MSMLGLEVRKIFVQHKCSVCSEPLRATLGWAPRGADMKQAESKDKSSHFQRMTLITAGSQTLERRMRVKQLRPELDAEMKPGAKSYCRREKMAQRPSRGFYRPQAVGFMGSLHNLNKPHPHPKVGVIKQTEGVCRIAEILQEDAWQIVLIEEEMDPGRSQNKDNPLPPPPQAQACIVIIPKSQPTFEES